MLFLKQLRFYDILMETPVIAHVGHHMLDQIKFYVVHLYSSTLIM